MQTRQTFKFLLVDTSAEMRKTMVTMLTKRFGCKKVYEADTGKKAWRVIREKKLDVIICEREMPGMSGLELLVKLKESDKYKDIPVMMFFNESDKDSVVKAIHLGVSELITKPFRPHELTVKIRRMIFQKERRKKERYFINDIKNEITVSEGAAVYSTGEVLNFSLSGLRAQLECNPKLSIYSIVDLRIKFIYVNDDNPAKTIRGQVVRIEHNPDRKIKGTALYSFMFTDMRPDQREFLEKIIKRVIVNLPDLIK